MPQMCPHCGKPMTQRVITENYEVFYACDCEGAKGTKIAEAQEKMLRKNPEPLVEKKLCEHCGELHELKYCCGICNAEICSRDCLEDHFKEKHPHHLIANPKTKAKPWVALDGTRLTLYSDEYLDDKKAADKNTLKEAERYLLEQTRKTHDRYIALGLVEEKYGTDIAIQLAKKYRIETSLDKRDPVKKNPLAGTDVWGHKLFIENPTREELQEIADALGVPVGIEKDLSKEMEMYKRFHHRKPTEIGKVEHPSTPKSLVALGKLESVIYRKCSDNQAYIHDLKHGLLCSDKKGKLWIVGDKARITKRGIVG